MRLLLAAPPPPPAINTRLPSGVNFSRLAPLSEIGRVCVTRLLAASMMVTVASCAFAAQISYAVFCLKKTTAPRAAAILGTRHVFRVTPAAGLDHSRPLLTGGG